MVEYQDIRQSIIVKITLDASLSSARLKQLELRLMSYSSLRVFGLALA